ncbi:hypothetical protein [Streptomyces sp. NBC_01477]|uniref:hypothetical protein n=1 Tax=Streptomyces sp. NBC_01477 TaxID=2976015 RepID=UPI002E313DF9|nr:hypothetical protein [Streptomyces sp. NBC_01477]
MDTDVQVPAEMGRETQMIMLAALLLILVGGSYGWRLLRRPPAAPDTAAAHREIGAIVLLAYGPDWAKRFGVDVQRLEAALLDGADPELLRRVDSEIGPVDLRFHRAAKGSEVTFTAEFDGPRGHATATADLPWDDVPQPVRADLLRGSASVLRTWRAVR